MRDADATSAHGPYEKPPLGLEVDPKSETALLSLAGWEAQQAATLRLSDLMDERANLARTFSYPVLVTRVEGGFDALLSSVVHRIADMVPRSKRPSAPLEDETARLSIGRSSENDVAVDDRSVSRRHASLVRRRGARWSVIDEGSSNGTFLDGSRLSPGVPMEVATSIAILRCGDASFSILRQAPFAQLLEAIASRPTNTRGDTSKIVYPEGVAGMRRTLPANARLSHVAETVLGRLKSTSIAARSYRVTLEGALVEDLVGLPRLLAFAEEQAARIVTIEAALGKGGTFLLYERPEEPLIA